MDFQTIYFMKKDFYEILGVSKTATKDEIKKAYYKLAHKFHPDKAGGDEAKFKEINEAYQVLSDDGKRSQYDRFGGNYNGGGAGAQQGGWGDFDFSNFSQGNGQGFGFDLNDIFSEFFGGGDTKMRRGRDISVDIQISFSESIFGLDRQMLISKIGTCDTCQGNGAEPNTGLKKCTTCNGQGKVNETRRSFMGSFATVRECPTCHGRGEVPEKPCHVCSGLGVHKKSEEIKVIIPAGINDGEMIRLSGKGEAAAGGVAGDLYVKIHVERHPIFKREGNNLLMDMELKLSEALLGTDRKITTLDGDLTVKVPVGVNTGEVLRVKEKGVPGRSKRGDILVKIKVKMPARLSKKAKKLIEDLSEEGI